MHKYLILALFILILPAADVHADTADDVVDEINIARTDPERYVKYLQDLRNQYTDRGIKVSKNHYLRTREGVDAVDEAISFMKDQSPMEPLSHTRGLEESAREMVEAQGPTRQTGHVSPEGLRPAARVEHYGRWIDIVGENIAYGFSEPRMIVLMWIVDDGVSSRSHREIMFNPEFRVAGAAIGAHQQYRLICVVDFAGGFVPF